MTPNGLAAVVTGGASGLGEATARALAAAGAKVAVIDRDADRANAVAGEIGGVGLSADVTDGAALEAAFAAARAAHGPCRILVACAGIAPGARIAGREGPMALDAFRRVVDVNLNGSFNALRLACAEMAAAEPLDGGERGVCVLTASVAGYEGQIGQAAYAASKAGVIGLVLPAAREMARAGVRVCAIAPGLFATPMMNGLPDDVQASLIETLLHPKRLGLPEEFARLALHICDNPMLNGETIRLDGALRLAPR